MWQDTYPSRIREQDTTLEYFAAPFIEEGGTGAVKGFDGWDGETGSIHSGALKRGSVEECELAFPFRWDIVEIANDSEGPGEFISGRGTYSERALYCAARRARTVLMSGDCDGAAHPPPGMAGAPPAQLGQIFIQRAGKRERDIFKTIDMGDMFPGDVLLTRTSGGAGWGDPLNRDPDRVRLNVRDGFLSMQRARDVYGVVITKSKEGDPETVEVDYEATKQIRGKMKVGQILPKISPSPGGRGLG